MTTIEQKANKDFSSRDDIPVTSVTQANEMSLMDIWQILKCRRKLILSIILAFVSVALLLVVILPRRYRSEIIVLPPFAKAAEQLTIPDFYEITVENLYGKFIQNLQSIELQKRFFKANDIYAALQQGDSKKLDEQIVFYRQFHKLLNVTKVSGVGKNNNTLRVALDGRDKGQIVNWLNNYVLLVDEYTVQQVVDSVLAKANVLAATVEEKIDNLRQIAKVRRSDRIAALEEAVAVAGKLKLSDPVGVVYSYRQEVKEKNREIINIKETPTYLRGTNALEAEVEALKKRKSDDPFIASLRDLQEKVSFYRGITLTGNNLHAARIDQEAVAEERPVKPNRNLIVALGVILGVIVGFLVAFMKEGFPVARNRH